jgi:hypothetical protein
MNIEINTSKEGKNLYKDKELVGIAKLNAQHMYQLQIDPIIEIVGYKNTKSTNDPNIIHAR